jgi:coenzyme F420-0:L-glutamate ligase/coenzyme F420-1:gamma-L-glutamate ligase
MDISLQDAIQRRQTVRRFRTTELSVSQRDALIDAASRAPSAHGRQPWKFVDIPAGGVRRQLCAAMEVTWRADLARDGQDALHIAQRIEISTARITTAPLLIMPCVDTSMLDHYPDQARQDAEYLMAVQSIGCAIQLMLLTAVQLGFDGGWMCAPLFCQTTVRGVLRLPETLSPQAFIPFGYMAQPPLRRPKRSGSELLIHVSEC